MVTIESNAEYEETIKKSRFVARAQRTDTVEAAERFIRDVRDNAATHNVWAYKIGAKSRCTDDKEPSGTAGRPVLTAIERKKLDHVTIVVTRYFGGIKLGAGGLIRAYGGAASKCLALAGQVPIIVHKICRLSIPFSLSSRFYPFIEQFLLDKISETFTENGITFELRMRADLAVTFRTAVMDLSNGSALIEWIEGDDNSLKVS